MEEVYPFPYGHHNFSSTSSSSASYAEYPILDSLYDGGNDAFLPFVSTPDYVILGAPTLPLPSQLLLDVLGSCQNLDGLSLGSAYPGTMSDAAHLTLTYDGFFSLGAETMMKVAERLGPKVKELNMKFVQIPGGGAGMSSMMWGEEFWRVFVSQLVGLKSLCMTMCDAGLDVAWFIPSEENPSSLVLESLDVSRPLVPLNDAFVESLGRLKSLKSLKLPGSQLEFSLSRLSETAPSLTSLHLQVPSEIWTSSAASSPATTANAHSPAFSGLPTTYTEPALVYDLQEESIVYLVSGGLPRLESLTIGSTLPGSTLDMASGPSFSFALQLIRARKNYMNGGMASSSSWLGRGASRKDNFKFQFCGIVVDLASSVMGLSIPMSTFPSVDSMTSSSMASSASALPSLIPTSLSSSSPSSSSTITPPPGLQSTFEGYRDLTDMELQAVKKSFPSIQIDVGSTRETRKSRKAQYENLLKQYRLASAEREGASSGMRTGSGGVGGRGSSWRTGLVEVGASA
jgi:hypothetical protein